MLSTLIRLSLFVFCVLIITGDTAIAAAAGSHSTPIPATENKHDNASQGFTASYGDKGLEFDIPAWNSYFWFGVRTQFRASSLDGNPVDPAKLEQMESSQPQLNRGRFKLGGSLFTPTLQIYSEYDFKNSMLLDYRATYGFSESIKIRIGQWKSEFNRERIDSSGKQQFVDRSIANYWFTVDRQTGLSFSGRIGSGQKYDSSYWIELLSGTGRGGEIHSDEYILLGRYQWNLFGEVLPFSQSDLKRLDTPAATLGAAAVYGNTKFTRYSSSGGGQLPGYASEPEGDFRLTQLYLESALHYRGFSYQQELHWKEIRDNADGSSRTLWGGYLQGGYFPHETWAAIPRPLEISGRYALVCPDSDGDSNLQQEWTLGLNWFFNGHRNKITTDVSHIALDSPDGETTETRFRLQWDFSF